MKQLKKPQREGRREFASAEGNIKKLHGNLFTVRYGVPHKLVGGWATRVSSGMAGPSAVKQQRTGKCGVKESTFSPRSDAI